MMRTTAIQTTTRLLFAALLSLGLMTGCATTGETGPTAAEAIAAAKSANAEARALGFEWNTTQGLIDSAEKALAAGKEDEAKSLADEARRQAENAIAQGMLAEKAMNDAALVGAESDMSDSKQMGAAAGVTSYSVVGGDNLWNISGKEQVYGNSYQWPLIYKNNRNKIKDADLIYPGQVFDIDQNPSSSAVDAAVNHAKTRGAWSVGDVEESDLDYLAR